jgi:hypothetical protein
MRATDNQKEVTRKKVKLIRFHLHHAKRHAGDLLIIKQGTVIRRLHLQAVNGIANHGEKYAHLVYGFTVFMVSHEPYAWAAGAMALFTITAMISGGSKDE